MEFLYLNEQDMIKAGVTDMGECISNMEEMLKLLANGDYRMSGPTNNGHGARVKFPQKTDIPGMPMAGPDRWFTAMPAYLGGEYHMFGIKSYGSNHGNLEKGLPRSILMMQLLDVDTGAPISYMSANILSAMRTGAMAGLGARWLSPKSAKVLGIIGPGVMSRYALDAILNVKPSICIVKVVGRGEKSLAAFKKWCEKYPDIELKIEGDVRSVCENADIIFTGNSRAETFEDNPYIDAAFLKRGALVISSSAVRFDNCFIHSDECVCTAEYAGIYEPGFDVDARPAKKETEDQVTYNVALHNMYMCGEKIISLSDVVRTNDFVRDDNKIYLYGAYGMPVEDVAWATEIYRNAKKKGIGTTLKIWDQSEL